MDRQQQISLLVVGVGVIRLDRYGHFEIRGGVFKSLHFVKRRASVGMAFNRSRINHDSFVIASHGIMKAFHIIEDISSINVVARGIRSYRHGQIKTPGRLGKSTQTPLCIATVSVVVGILRPE